jgi:hypothetical protein
LPARNAYDLAVAARVAQRVALGRSQRDAPLREGLRS